MIDQAVVLNIICMQMFFLLLYKKLLQAGVLELDTLFPFLSTLALGSACRQQIRGKAVG